MTEKSTAEKLREIAKSLRMGMVAMDPAIPAATLEEAATEIEEHERSFELRWKADMRAVERWRAAAPGRDLTLPDHADLCVWLLEQLDDAREKPAAG